MISPDIYNQISYSDNKPYWEDESLSLDFQFFYPDNPQWRAYQKIKF